MSPIRTLRHGYTTGSCATAAAKAAILALLRQECIKEIEITLPKGETVGFEVHSCTFDKESARCSVIKDAGDDPDVTNGAEICAEIFAAGSQESEVRSHVVQTPPSPLFTKEGVPMAGELSVVESGLSTKKAFEFTANDLKVAVFGGKGVGTITKPGLALPVGEPAINPVPRKMIQQAIEEALNTPPSPTLAKGGVGGVAVIISVPEGERIAKSTLNERLGIVGGISILGTTGIVKPISTKAWADTISVALDVAKAAGLEEVVLTTGRTSEQVAVNTLKLPSEAYIQMGDHVGYTLKECVKKGFKKATIAGQFGKFTKIASGEFETNVRDSTLELKTLADMVISVGAGLKPAPTIQNIADKIMNGNTARHAFSILKENGMDEVINEVCRKVCENSENFIAGDGLHSKIPSPGLRPPSPIGRGAGGEGTVILEIKCMLVGYEGEIVFAV